MQSTITAESFANADVSPRTESRDDELGTQQQLHILVVDDNEDAADLLAHTLRFLGHEVSVAFDAQAALEIVEVIVPDLAILDIGLPGMDGYELAQRLRGMPLLATKPLVALTGYGSAADRERSKAAGFDVHITKPLRRHELMALLRLPSASCVD